MTVLEASDEPGRLQTVAGESDGADGQVSVDLVSSTGVLNADLRLGAPVHLATALRANDGISGMGVALHGPGFILEPEVAEQMRAYGASVIRGYMGGRDLLQVPRERYLIDFSGLSADEARAANPAAFQRVIDYVKPERDNNNRASIRELWWRFGWERPLLRRALVGLDRYIGTTETAKHRVFQFLSGDVIADHMIVCIAVSTAETLGVLSSSLHATWSLVAGGTLEDRPRYNKNRCFDPFPFPILDETQRARIGELAEAIDAHRKRQQAAFPGLTLTGMYNVLEALRRGDPLSAKERVIHEQGLVSVLRELHDALDRAVFEAYGWADLGERLVGRPGATTPWPEKPAEQAEAEEELLSRLVALNAERAAEEARGLVRWLRPDFQARAAGVAAGVDGDTDAGDDATLDTSVDATAPAQGTLIDADAVSPAPMPADTAAVPRRKLGKRRATAAATAPTAAEADAPHATDAGAPRERIAWPKTAPEQARAVAEVLARARGPLALDAIAAHFTGRGRWRDRLPELLDTLTALGRAHRSADTWRAG